MSKTSWLFAIALLLTNSGWLVGYLDAGLAHSDTTDSLGDAQRALCVLAQIEPVQLSKDDLRRFARRVGIDEEYTFEQDGLLVVDAGILYGVLDGERVVRIELPEEIWCDDPEL